MSQKLHILFLCGWFPSRVSPTNGDFIERHAKAVALKQFVSVLHIITDENATKNLEIVTKKEGNLTTHIAYLKKAKNKIQKTSLFIKAFFLLLKKIKRFDVVHLNEIYPFGIFSLYLKVFRKKPYIISEHHTIYLKDVNIKIGFLKKIVSKYIVKKAFAISCVSDYLSKNLKDLGFTGNYITLPNVVDTALFTPKKKNEEALKIVHVSSLKDAHKNIKGMLRVAKKLDTQLGYFEWKFIGNNGNEYENFIRDLSLKNCKIYFLEHQSQDELVKNLQEASVCISFSNYETFGIVIPEAIACGTPVISTKTGVAIDLINTDFCKVIPIKNEEILFHEILNSKKTFAKLNSSKMHSFVEQQFSKEVISNKFSLLYYQSLKK